MYLFLLLLTTLMMYVCFIRLFDKIDKLVGLIICTIYSFLVMNLSLLIYFGNMGISHLENNMNFMFIIKYLILSVFMTIVSVYGIKFCRNNFEIKKNVFKKRKKKIIISNIVLFALFLLMFALKYLLGIYKAVPPEQLAFHLQVPITGTSTDVFKNIFNNIFTFPIIIMFFLNFQYFVFKKSEKQIVFNFKKKKLNVLPFRFYEKKYIIIALVVLSFSLIYSFKNYNIYEFVKNQFAESDFIEKNYKDPKKVKMSFPKEKKNLIYIYLESMETTYKEYTPNLHRLANENISFSNSKGYGGFSELVGANWTIASMVAQTSGLPLKVSVDSSSYNANEDAFLNGVYTLGDLLKDNGYNNYIMMGSNADFAYRRNYFNIHGKYDIFDYLKAIEEGYIDDDYFKWWGFEDRKLYEYSKEKLLEAAAEDKPFNFSILTVDTHYTDGYLDEECAANHSEQYANVLECADTMFYDFMKWLRKQDFYDDTTVIIVGDHLYMEESDFFDKYNERYVYNSIINSSVKTDNIKNRTFTALDMFPTTLSAMGVKIEGDKLGLGVDLFSNKKTLVEKYGFDYVNDELKKKSTFYNDMSLYEE